MQRVAPPGPPREPTVSAVGAWQGPFGTGSEPFAPVGRRFLGDVKFLMGTMCAAGLRACCWAMYAAVLAHLLYSQHLAVVVPEEFSFEGTGKERIWCSNFRSKIGDSRSKS